jgi:hypothetical protein
MTRWDVMDTMACWYVDMYIRVLHSMAFLLWRFLVLHRNGVV